MTLKAQIAEELTRITEHGQPLDRPKTISLLRGALNHIPDHVEDTPQAPTTHGGDQFRLRENTPVRTRVSNWTLSCCKRCGRQGAPDGSWIVRIHGKGWWHDECYRVVNPDFYVGL